ncbi:MAG: glycosidase [Candidatus Brocadiaceae bacterium]|nr:glycosidase [Candidatus Brocadiaceae bacterium]
MDTARRRHSPDLFRRYDGNPILSAHDWPYRVHSVFNAGAVRLDSGEVLLLARAEDMRGLSHLCAARSADGLTDWRIDPAPTMSPDPRGHPEEVWGLEDPRITFLSERGEYAVAYTAYSRGGPGVSLAFTHDFHTFRRSGMVFPPDDKDAALFPCRFGGRWAMVHRPTSPDREAHVWLSFSPDLKHWGDHTILMEARRGAWWDAGKIGLSTPPIETERGWLILYHGVRVTAAGSLYRLGLALLDRDDPLRVLLRGEEWVFGAEEPYERVGDVPDVVFPCGAVVGEDGDGLHLYYGAADTSLCVATSRVTMLLDWLETHGRRPDGDP